VQDYEEPGEVSKWSGTEQIVKLGNEEYQPEMEHADSGLERWF
jgi:hypothetical protein